VVAPKYSYEFGTLRAGSVASLYVFAIVYIAVSFASSYILL
jgi:hypothetical protein